MKSMEFTKATVEKVAETIKKHGEEFSAIRNEGANLTIEEIAQKLIIDKFNEAQIEAEDIVNDLKKGLAKFDAQFSENKATETINVKENLEKACENCTDEERKNYYVNVLTAIELLNAGELTEEDVKAKLAKNAELSNEELLAKIEKVMNSSISLEELSATVKDGVNAEALSKLSKEIELKKDEYRLMTAVWLYIEQREGNLKLSDSDNALSAEQLGVMAGAAIETIITNNALSEGKIDLATWQKIVKYILGAALVLAWTSLSIVACSTLGFFAFTSFLTMIGTSMFAIMFSFVIVAIFVSDMMEWSGEGMKSVIAFLGDVYDKYIVKITAKISSWVEKLKEWVTKTKNETDETVANGNNSVEKKPTEEQVVSNGEEETAIAGEALLA